VHLFVLLYDQYGIVNLHLKSCQIKTNQSVGLVIV